MTPAPKPIALTLLALFSAPIVAAETVVTLPPVIVTASKAPEPQKDVTQKVSIISSEDFDQIAAPQRNAAELLRNEPGLFVNPLSRNDANWGSYGGLGPKYNSFLLDGLPVDAFVDPMSLDPWAFSRVESQRGPASVMYGNYLSMDFSGNQSPLAGVSHFVLKERIDTAATRLAVAAGTQNTWTARAYHQGYTGNLHYFVGTAYESSDYTAYGQPNSWLDTVQSPNYRKTKLYGKATWFFDRPDHKLSLFAHYTAHAGDLGRPNRDFDHSYGTLNASYSKQLSPTLGMQAKIGLRDYDRRWSEDNYPGSLSWRERDSVKQRIVPADLTFTLAHGKAGVLTLGADTQRVDYRTYADNNRIKTAGNDVTARSSGLFVQERWTLGDWVLRAGGRYNRTTHDYTLIAGGAPGLALQSWNKFLWSTGARFNASPTLALYANFGTSFTPPSAKSVGGTLRETDAGVAGRNGQLPNPALKPESGRGADFGVDATPVQGMSLGARLFYNGVQDAIVDNAVSTTPSQTRSINAGKARSTGLELTWKHRLSYSVQTFANLTLTRTRVSNPLDPNQDGAELSFVPRQIANLGVNLNFGEATRVSPSLQYVGRYYDSTDTHSRSAFGHYAVFSLTARHEISRSFALTADLYNLGNRKFDMPWAFRDVGFSGSLGVEGTF